MYTYFVLLVVSAISIRHCKYSLFFWFTVLPKTTSARYKIESSGQLLFRRRVTPPHTHLNMYLDIKNREITRLVSWRNFVRNKLNWAPVSMVESVGQPIFLFTNLFNILCVMSHVYRSVQLCEAMSVLKWAVLLHLIFSS